tara:strand:- start:2579 stop:4189 length:1611 start_codon:yes stop_codon:yes gene_type:complete
LVDRKTKEILILASDLLGQSLAAGISTQLDDIEVSLSNKTLSRRPSLVIWSIDSIELPSLAQIELKKLKQNWHPSPILLILPSKTNLKQEELMQFDCPGLLQDPDLNTLNESIKTIISGGKVVKLKEVIDNTNMSINRTIGLGQWLLISGLQQINNDLNNLELHEKIKSRNSIELFILYGRRRELHAAKTLISWLWQNDTRKISEISDDRFTTKETSIVLNERNSKEISKFLIDRIKNSLKDDIKNSTSRILAFDALTEEKRSSLLLAIIDQFDLAIKRMRKIQDDDLESNNLWGDIQAEIKKESIRNFIGSYVQIPYEGKPVLLSQKLVSICNYLSTDDDLPKSNYLLDPLLKDKPILVEGHLLSPDNPKAIIQQELYIYNWLIRTAEIISEELLEVCSSWQELRLYILNPSLISTRELDKLRNRLNTKNRWDLLIMHPIRLYESKRLLFTIKSAALEEVIITEPRDEELRQLGWFQQQVAIAIEIRDALAPQLQALTKSLGDLMVLILTQILGKAIGLIGKGIAQGMGRSLGRG